MYNSLIMRHRIVFAAILASFVTFSGFSQGKTKAAKEVATYENNEQKVTVDLMTLQLPPLRVLYANARNNPSIEILQKEKELQKKLLEKEKKQWLTFFSARASIAHGVTDNYGTMTDPLTPVFYQYSGVEQTYWNVGGNINIPLETLLDLPGKVKRQRIAVERADMLKEQAFDELKKQIITLYVQIQSNIELLKSSTEYLALYKGASAAAEQEFRHRRTTIEAVADTKRREYEANSSFVTLQATIYEQLLMLEIISRTTFVVASTPQ
ncbi:MAG: TolC family protein [Phocaeicola sp.]